MWSRALNGKMDLLRPVNQWLRNKNFVRAIPEDEKLVATCGLLVSLKTKKVDEHDNMELFRTKNVTKLFEIVNTVMARNNCYEKARRMLAIILNAHKKSL